MTHWRHITIIFRSKRKSIYTRHAASRADVYSCAKVQFMIMRLNLFDWVWLTTQQSNDRTWWWIYFLSSTNHETAVTGQWSVSGRAVVDGWPTVGLAAGSVCHWSQLRVKSIHWRQALSIARTTTETTVYQLHSSWTKYWQYKLSQPIVSATMHFWFAFDMWRYLNMFWLICFFFSWKAGND